MSKAYDIQNTHRTLKRFADVHDTTFHIQRIVKENYLDPKIEQLANMLAGRGDDETFYNIWQYVRNNIKYQRDDKGSEQLRTPMRTLRDRMGDCDDMSILISSILMNLGYKHELVVAAYKSKNAWQHIYPAAYAKDSGERFVIDCVPEIPHFNYEAKPIVNQIIIDMKLEELGMASNMEDPSSEMIMEMTAPFSLDGLGFLDEDEEIFTIQGLLGDVLMVDEDEPYDTVLSGSELKTNIMLRQLVKARDTLKKEISYPTELSQITEPKKELALINDIIENFDDEQERELAIQDAIAKDTFYKNFYKTIQYGIDDAINGLAGDEEDQYYLKVMEEEGLLDDLIDDDDEVDGVDDLGRRKARKRRGGFKKLKSKIKNKVANFKKKHPKLAKVGHALTKFSPTGFTLRRSLEAFLVANVGGISEKIAIGYATEAQAKKMGYSRAEWMQFVEGRKKAEDKWHALGGEKSHFKKIIMKGRGGRKAGLRGYDQLGELAIAPAIISAAMKVFGFVVEFFKKLKLKKQEKAAGADSSSASNPGAMPGEKRAGAANDFSEDPGDDGGSSRDSNVTTDEKTGVSEEITTDENGKEVTIYKDKEGNEIKKMKYLFLKNKKWIIIVGCVIVVGIIAIIIWKVRQGMSGLGRAIDPQSGLPMKQANYLRRQQLNNRAYASLIREEIRRDKKKLTPGNRKTYYKKVFRDAFSRPLSNKQVDAANKYNNMLTRVRALAKENGGGSSGWKKAWSEVKKKS